MSLVEPRRFGGWIVLALVVIFFAPLRLLAVFNRLTTKLGRLDDLSAIFGADRWEWAKDIVFNFGSSLVLAVLAIITMAHAFPKRRAAIRWFQIYFATSLVLSVPMHLYDTMNLRSESQTLSWGMLAWRLVIAALWLRYFRKNQRVKETFVRPTVGERW